MTSTIPAQIDEQSRIVVFGEEAAMEFGKTIAHHIGDMQVTDLPIGTLMDNAPVSLYPLTITSGPFIREGLDGNHANFSTFRSLDGQLYLVLCLVDKEFLRATAGTHTLPVDCQDGIACRNIQAR